MLQLETPTVSDRMASALMSAVAFAGEQLSGFMERPIRLRGTQVERLRLERLPDLQADADRAVIAIYLSFSGALEGHVILSFSPEAASRLAGLLLMEPEIELPLDDMARSAMGEVGNITAASFLNALANSLGMIIHPSPPTIVQDMIGALLSNVVLEMAMESTDALLVHTLFDLEGERLQGEVLLLPTAASCDILESELAQCK